MGSLDKELTKRRKKELKARLKAEKKRRKSLEHVTPTAESDPNTAAVPPPGDGRTESDQLKEESVRINRWRLWAAIIGVLISAAGLALKIFQFLNS